MEDHVKIIEINITKEDAMKHREDIDPNDGYVSDITRILDSEHSKFMDEFTFGTDEFREKYKNGYRFKINYI